MVSFYTIIVGFEFTIFHVLTVVIEALYMIKNAGSAGIEFSRYEDYVPPPSSGGTSLFSNVKFWQVL